MFETTETVFTAFFLSALAPISSTFREKLPHLYKPKEIIRIAAIIENILDSEGKANFESAEDNLQDLATYAIMMLAYIKKGGDK